MDVFKAADWVSWDDTDQHVAGQLGVCCSRDMAINLGCSQCGCLIYY
jgi:hypothetical protein